MSRSSTRCQREDRSKGFTLLEVIIAFTILAIAMSALLQVFGTGLKGLRTAEGYTLAVMHARSKMSELGTLIPLQDGEQSGEFDDGFRWSVSILPHAPPAGSDWSVLKVQAYDVEVTVSWDESRTITVRTLRLAYQQ